MVIRVKLKGLKIARNKAGRYFVYVRGNPKAILKNFEGDRNALLARLAEPDMLTIYNAHRKRELNRVYAEGTLGSLVAWFRTDCPAYAALADSTKGHYEKAFAWLETGFDCPLALITTPELYDLRDRCAKERWPSFADQVIAALSSMFSQAVKRKKMLTNPCLGMDKVHRSDPNANREWFEHEWRFASENAPLEILIPLMIARYAGLSGQTIATLNRDQFIDHELTGKAVRYVRRKNGKAVLLPVLPELQDFMKGMTVQSANGLLALRDSGTPWANEKDMQTRVSNWLRKQERNGKIGAGTTLHGLRVSYAAWWKRNGASNAEVAELIGDRSEAMGRHYTRHVESEVSIVRAFNRIKNTE